MNSGVNALVRSNALFYGRSCSPDQLGIVAFETAKGTARRSWSGVKGLMMLVVDMRGSSADEVTRRL